MTQPDLGPLAESKRLLSQGDERRALARLKALMPPHESGTNEHFVEFALLAIEQDAVELAKEAMAHTVDANTHKTSALVNELLALQPKIPSAYLRLFAEGTRTGLTHDIRTQLDELKRENLADASEVFGQLGLRAPKLRQTYGVLMDPLLNGDGTPRKAPWHWGWLLAGAALVTSLALSLARLEGSLSSAPPATSDVEVADDADAMLGSAVNLICSDRPERCEDARMLHRSLDQHACSGVEARIERLDEGNLNDASGDAIRLLQQRVEHACGVAANAGATP